MKKQYFFDNPKKAFFKAFYVLLGLSVLMEVFIHKHTSFRWEEYPLFYAAFGFLAFASLILVAKYIIRPLLKRKEDYYDD